MNRFSSDRLRRRRAADKTRKVVPEGFDPLTGLATRELFHDRAAEQWDKGAHTHQPVTLIMIGVDHFSELRATSGGAAGEACLKAVSNAITRRCGRRADLSGRVRDHEMAVLLAESEERGALALAEKIRRDVEGLRLKTGAGPEVITISVGVASLVPRQNRFVEALLIAADQGLKTAYAQGGNRVVAKGDQLS